VVGFGPAVSSELAALFVGEQRVVLSEPVALFVGEQRVPVLVELLVEYGRTRLVVSNSREFALSIQILKGCQVRNHLEGPLTFQDIL